jgi:hypothetical protein
MPASGNRSGFPGRLDKESSMSTPEPTTATPLDSGAGGVDALPDYAPVPRSALGPALNDRGYDVGRVERNPYWVADGTYQAAFASVIARYTGVLAAADVFTPSTTFWVMESIRLDLGYGSYVHP